MPAIPEVTLGRHSSGTLTIPRCKIGIRPWPGNSELTVRIITHKWEQSTGDDQSTLALKPNLAESTKIWNRKYRCFHNMVTCHRKKKNTYRYIILAFLIFHIYGIFLWSKNSENSHVVDFCWENYPVYADLRYLKKQEERPFSLMFLSMFSGIIICNFSVIFFRCCCYLFSTKQWNI